MPGRKRDTYLVAILAQGAYIVFVDQDVFALSKGGAVAVTLVEGSRSARSSLE